MENFLTVLGSITALGAFYVVGPVVADAYRRFRAPRTVTCPENQAPAEVGLDVRKAATSAAFGKPHLQIVGCSRWTQQQQSCGQGCLAEIR